MHLFCGRVDFMYDGDNEPEPFYIGIGNFRRKKQACKPLIYDWRAPVSSLFYDYDKGPASYEAPAGRLDGEILSKWQFKVQNGELVYAFESDTKIDDDILKKELGTNSDVKLKKYCPHNPERTECNYPKYKRSNPCNPGSCRKWKNFDCFTPNCISFIS